MPFPTWPESGWPFNPRRSRRSFSFRTPTRGFRREVFSLQNRELIYPFLSKGYADAIAAHETAILQYMSDYRLEYRILDEPLLTVGLGVAFALDDARGLEQALSDIFEQMRADGTMEEIIGRYLDEPLRYMEGKSDEGEIKS